MNSAPAKKKTGSKAESREIELKMELAFGGIENLFEHEVFSRAHPLPAQGGVLHAIYYDTPDHALRRAGLSLRVRDQNGRSVQTIKAERAERSLAFDRSEWECPVEGVVDMDAAAGTPLDALLSDETVRGHIQPVFVVDTKRRAFEIVRDNSVIELALDRAKVKAGNKCTRFAEVELELKKGDPSALFAIARDLANVAPLRFSTMSKSERGYRLLREADAEAVHASPVDIPAGLPSAEAFQIIARACLSQIVQNEAVVRQNRDPEALHQMRVGLRRLNAARSLFKPMLKGRESDAIRADLRWIGKKFGRVRDLDVYAGRLHETKAEVDESALKETERRRTAAYDSLLDTLEKPRFMGAILRVAAWIETGKWLRRKKKGIRTARNEPVEDRAVTELARRWKQIRKRARKVADLDERQRHKLRMRIKKLRYGVEFFSTTFPGRRAGKRCGALLPILQDLQNDLGEMNDIAIAKTLFPALAEAESGQAARRMDKLLSLAKTSSRKLQKTKPFWEPAAAVS